MLTPAEPPATLTSRKHLHMLTDLSLQEWSGRHFIKLTSISADGKRRAGMSTAVYRERIQGNDRGL